MDGKEPSFCPTALYARSKFSAVNNNTQQVHKRKTYHTSVLNIFSEECCSSCINVLGLFWKSQPSLTFFKVILSSVEPLLMDHHLCFLLF